MLFFLFYSQGNEAATEGRANPAFGAETMKKKQLEQYQKLLQTKQTEMTRNFSKNQGESRSSVDDGTEDYIDYAVNSYAKEFLLSLTDMERQQLVLIDEALGRIRSGDYGHCQQCNQEINGKRLEAAPWARHCVRCQELEEQGLLPQYAAGARDDEYEEEGVEAPSEEREELFSEEEE